MSAQCTIKHYTINFENKDLANIDKRLSIVTLTTAIAPTKPKCIIVVCGERERE